MNIITYIRNFILTAFILLLTSQLTYSQAEEQGIRVGIKLPYTYDIGYFVRFNTRFAIHLSTQFVTLPFSKVPTTYMNLLGADEDITAILYEPYSIGAGLDIGVHYYFGTDNRRYYFSFSVQWMNLLKRDIDDDVINTAFDVDLNSSDIPLGPISKNASTKPLTLNTNYVNTALAFGKIIPLQNPNTEIRIEGALSKIIFSHHNLQSDYRYISPIAEITNESLQKTMKKYGWFPTLNVYFIYKLN